MEILTLANRFLNNSEDLGGKSYNPAIRPEADLGSRPRQVWN
jgi:hypothetical protein